MQKVKITITNAKILNEYITGSPTKDIHNGVVRETGGMKNYCVLLSLVSHADNVTKESYPSMETIANELGTSTRTVIRVLDDLEKRGFITRELAVSTKSRLKHNVYTLHLSEISQEEENKSDVDRLYDYFKTKFRERYDKEYVSDYGIDSDMNFLTKLLADCGDNFEYACAIVAKHIDSYLGKKGYETPNIYFLYKSRLTAMKKKVDKDLELQKRIENPPKPKGRLKNFASEDYNPNDDMDKIENLNSDEFEQLFTDDDKRKWEIANF